MKLSNYLVLLVALVFLGGMTGCGKGNSAGGGDSSTSSSTPTVTTTNVDGYGEYNSIISSIFNKNFVSPRSSTSEFIFDYFSSSSSSSSSGWFTVNCSGFSASWCDNSNGLGDDNYSRKMSDSNNLMSRESGDNTSLPTNLDSLASHLGELAKTAYSNHVRYGGFIGRVYGDANTLVMRVGTSSNYQVYYIDLRYPLAAQPVRIENWQMSQSWYGVKHKLQNYSNLRYEF